MWYLVAQRGSRRQFKHRTKSDRVTVAGHPTDELAPGTLRSIMKQPRLEASACVTASSSSPLSGYAQDVPGCVATGSTVEEVRTRMAEAIALHLQGLREDGLPAPPPATVCEYVVVAA